MSNPKHEKFASSVSRAAQAAAKSAPMVSPLPEDFYTELQQDRRVLKEEAGRILMLRHRRTQEFGHSMFSEPAWEMILNLYASDSERMDVPSLFALVSVSERIGQRWLDHLEEAGLVQRTGGGATDVTLTDKGRFALDGYLTELRAPGTHGVA